jgi:hypothetical protein
VKEYIIAVGSIDKCIGNTKSHRSLPLQFGIPNTIPVHHSSPPLQSTIAVHHCSRPLQSAIEESKWYVRLFLGKEYTRAVGSIDESIGSMRCYLSSLLQSDSDPLLRSAKVESER